MKRWQIEGGKRNENRKRRRGKSSGDRERLWGQRKRKGYVTKMGKRNEAGTESVLGGGGWMEWMMYLEGEQWGENWTGRWWENERYWRLINICQTWISVWEEEINWQRVFGGICFISNILIIFFYSRNSPQTILLWNEERPFYILPKAKKIKINK